MRLRRLASTPLIADQLQTIRQDEALLQPRLGGDRARQLRLLATQDRGEYINQVKNITRVFLYLPWTARASAEQLYLPSDVLAAIHEPWRPEHALQLARGWFDWDKRVGAPARRKAAGPARKRLPRPLRFPSRSAREV